MIASNRTTPAILKEMTDDFNVSQTAAMTLVKGLHDVVPVMQKRDNWKGLVSKSMDELPVVSHCHQPWDVIGCDDVLGVVQVMNGLIAEGKAEAVEVLSHLIDPPAYVRAHHTSRLHA